MSFNNKAVSAVANAIANVSTEDLIVAMDSAKYIADGNPASIEYYEDVNKAAFAIVEPVGADEDYWEVVEDDYNGWVEWIGREFGAYWKKIAIHVKEEGY